MQELLDEFSLPDLSTYKKKMNRNVPNSDNLGQAESIVGAKIEREDESDLNSNLIKEE